VRKRRSEKRGELISRTLHLTRSEWFAPFSQREKEQNCFGNKSQMSQCNSNEALSMVVQKPVRMLGTLVILIIIPLFSTVAQTQLPASSSAGTPPASMRQEIVAPPAQRQAPATRGAASTAASTKARHLLGLSVFSSEGTKLGSVRSVAMGMNGTTNAIYLRTGGFLGFGGKLVAIPVGKFTHDVEKIFVHMSTKEISKLAAVDEQG
jgi:hypothetical protein